jgi:pimeloyl-ACP methyl ester carboxylesterase
MGKKMGASLAAPFVFPAPRSDLSAYRAACEGIHRANGQWGLLTPRPGCVISMVAFPDPARTAILYSHGNSEDLGTAWDSAWVIHQTCGLAVYAYDYPGYGLSTPGPCSEAGLRGAAQVVMQHVLRHHEQVILVGHSLGTAASCFLASSGSPAIASTLLLAPFLSVGAVVFNARRSLPVGDLLRNDTLVPRIRCPLFIVHGNRDTVVPVHHSRVLASFATAYKEVHGLGHTSMLTHPEVQAMLLRIVASTASASGTSTSTSTTKL